MQEKLSRNLEETDLLDDKWKAAITGVDGLVRRQHPNWDEDRLTSEVESEKQSVRLIASSNTLKVVVTDITGQEGKQNRTVKPGYETTSAHGIDISSYAELMGLENTTRFVTGDPIELVPSIADSADKPVALVINGREFQQVDPTPVAA